MHYCIIEGYIDMVISERPDKWRIPTIPREVQGQTTEGGAMQAETQPPKIPVPKKQRMGQTKSTQADDGLDKQGTQKERKKTTQLNKGQRKLAEGAQETASDPIT
jgi:hypothetical protein